MSEIKLTAQPRTEFGKGAARRIRREHQVPAVVYGHGTDPQHIQLPGHDTMLALKSANALLSITVGEAKPVLALVKDVQRDPVRQVIEHVDLVIVRRGEKVQVDVPVHVVGEAAHGSGEQFRPLGHPDARLRERGGHQATPSSTTRFSQRPRPSTSVTSFWPATM